MNQGDLVSDTEEPLLVVPAKRYFGANESFQGEMDVLGAGQNGVVEFGRESCERGNPSDVASGASALGGDRFDGLAGFELL